jgi:hypothetical protein
LIVDDLDAEIDRLRSAGLAFRSDVIAGPGGQQILLADPTETSSNSSNRRNESLRGGWVITSP